MDELLPSAELGTKAPAPPTSLSSPTLQRKPLPGQPTRKPPPPPLMNGPAAPAQPQRPLVNRFMTPPDGALRQKPAPPTVARVSDEIDSYLSLIHI